MTAQRGRVGAARLLAVLAVLLGLLAMHGLVTGHHVNTTGMPAVAAAQASAPDPDDSSLVPGAMTAMHAGAGHLTDTVARVALGPVLSAPGCADCPAHDVATLCLAVLTAVAAAAAALLAHRQRTGTATVAHHRKTRACRVLSPLLRPPDLVAELCVSRT